MSLALYKKKRNFKQTREPSGTVSNHSSFRFVVQKHHASHLHYDFRLELGGVLKSWAVPKGPSTDPAEKRLAVQVEDHPVDYINFKGTIAKGNYGAGKVDIWDKGNFEPVDAKHKPITEKKALANIKAGELKIRLKGKKLKGEFVLVRLKNADKNWLLIKHTDVGKNRAQPAAALKRAKKITPFVHPMLASIHDQPFNDPGWLFEIKWDGYRAIAEINSHKTPLLYSRNGLDFSERFTSICKALQSIKHNAIIDGEIVLLNKNGIPDFQQLQHYENHMNQPLLYYVFDLLELNGKKTTGLPLSDRKKLLKKLIGRRKTQIRYCDHIEKDGIGFWKQAKQKGLEGIIGKKMDSEYAENKRSKEWLKIKNIQSTEALIAGYTKPKGSRNHFGALILATQKGRQLQYRGHVGTGFNEEALRTLKKKMEPLEMEKSPFKETIPLNDIVTWLRPKLVADISYTEITRDNIFRHPVFLRLRDEKKATQLNEETPEKMDTPAKKPTIKVGSHLVTISNRNKIFWPDEGYTKGDVLDYYNNISGFILPHLKNRPLSLKRNPNGILDKGFFHKDAGEHAPDFAEVFKVKSGSTNKTIDYIVCNNKATLLYIANLGSIEINPWNSTVQAVDNPTWAVIDIDPSPQNNFRQVVDTALAVKQVLDKGGVPCFCKTSGATGLHVYIPLKNKYNYDTVKDFAHVVASLTQALVPDFTTLERSLAKRGPNIYIDYLQNRPGQTLSSVYSLRPVAGATVSTPLDWKEVNHQLTPRQFNIKNIIKRLQSKGDLFKGVLTGSTNISKALRSW